MISRPQPLGILPLPAGWLVLPAEAVADDVGAAVRDRLMAGELPPAWPAALRAVELAVAGDVQGAAAAIDPKAGPEHAYDHFVLTGEPVSLELAVAGARAAGDTDLLALLAVAAYALGRAPVDQLPDPDAPDSPVERLTGEVAAHVLAAHTAAALERGDAQRALDLLVRAEQAAAGVSPVLAALLLGQQAALLQDVNGADADVVAGYREAVDVLAGKDAVATAAAELTLGLATAHQELGSLQEAVRTYHVALRLLRKESQPDRYAFAHSNLALCYLSMPMTQARDTLRRGVAVQSLREALSIYTRADHPREWAAVTLNLANALQHLPTTHPVENLVEAVGMYEELLVARPVDVDPLGHARVLANQGTALAHLGIHDQARPKLAAARGLFAAAGDDGAVATVDAALADVETAVTAGAGANAGAGAGER